MFVPLADSLAPALRQALAAGPRLRAARLEVERGEAEVARSRNGLWPSTTLSAGLDRVPGSDRPGVGGAVEVGQLAGRSRSEATKG